MNNDKVKTYISFAIKSGTCALGIDNILKMRHPKVILTAKGLSPNSQNKIKNKFGNVPCFETDFVLGQNTENVLALAISNQNLADACIKILSKKENGGQNI